MTDGNEICGQLVVLHAVIGSLAGALFVALLLAFDVAGLGSMLQQVRDPFAHMLLLFIKPMMLLGVSAVAWSVWQQLHASPARAENREQARRPAFLSNAMSSARL